MTDLRCKACTSFIEEGEFCNFCLTFADGHGRKQYYRMQKKKHMAQVAREEKKRNKSERHKDGKWKKGYCPNPLGRSKRT